MKVFVLLLALIALSTAVKWYELSSYTFDHFKRDFNPAYENEDEMKMRKNLFEKRMIDIKRHNLDPTKTWKMGVNRFADRTDAEFRKLLGVRKDLLLQSKLKSTAKAPVEEIDVSVYQGQKVDWRDAGIISPVKDQGQCGSCWSFATAETLESYWAQSTKQLVELSEQQILDCTPNPNDCGGTGGCGGGTAELAYAQINKQGGLATEWTYPYQSYFGSNYGCRFGGNTPPYAQVSGYTDLPSNVYAPVLQHVATIGPLAVSVDASAWSFYESGVFDGCNQTNPDLDHAVQLVGFGTDPSLGDYWLVRNSWSPAWGEQGYIRLRRTSNLRCGTDLAPGDGDGCNGGPSTVTVCGTCGILYDTLYPTIQTLNKKH